MQAINRHLPGTLFAKAGAAGGGRGGGVRWCERYLTLCVILMAWGINTTLADRFDEARRCLVKMFPGRRRPGTTYTGFMAAMVASSEPLLQKVADHLRGEVRRTAAAAAAGDCWHFHGFVPIAADGSKVECPMTRANEEAFGCAGKKKSTPQQFVTTLLHLPTGIVWDFACGDARASERHHLRAMLPTLPDDALLIADAGFTGYDLLSAIRSSGKHLLIRVGANVRLLTRLGYALEERDGTVYLWPQDQQKDRQPPLVLRLITLIDPRRNRRMHLLSSVLDAARLPDTLARELYTMRWGVELHYRALKQTLQRRKLAGDAPATARVELRWAMIGLWLLALMGVSAIRGSGSGSGGGRGGGGGGNPRMLSIARALRLVRAAMRRPTARAGSCGFHRQLSRALLDQCQRHSVKKARHWPHRKTPPPIGVPKARKATRSEVDLAKRLGVELLAA
jgi:hypothetical protein